LFYHCGSGGTGIAGVTVTKTQTSVHTAPQAKLLSDAARDQAYFRYPIGTIVAGASK